MSEIAFNLPWPPSANRYWRNYNGRVVVSAEARAYKAIVRKTILEKLKKVKENARLFVEINVYPPDKRRRDIDNIPKVVLDTISRQKEKKNGKIITHEGLGFDDCQIDKLIVERGDLSAQGKVLVKIREILSEQKK